MPKSRLDDRAFIPPFYLSSKENEIFDSFDFKRKKSLVLFFLTELKSDFLLKAEEQYSSLRKNNAELVIICPLTDEETAGFYKKNRLTYGILSDRNMEVFSKFISFEKDEPVAALFITDRSARIFFQYVENQMSLLPDFNDVIKSVELIESQYPEL